MKFQMGSCRSSSGSANSRRPCGCPTSIADISDPGLSCPLTISTLQKDNPLIWIADWLKWHHREHGVGRAVLYDNGSSNRDELIGLPEGT